MFKNLDKVFVVKVAMFIHRCALEHNVNLDIF